MLVKNLLVKFIFQIRHFTILLNRYLVYRSKVPAEGLAKHNAAIHTAMNPRNGVIYAWKHIKTSTWPDQVFVGKLKNYL